MREDHRSRISKILIRDAFVDLLSTKTINEISVKELCAKADINRGTFYSHYLDINDLLNHLEEELIMEFKSKLEPLLNSTVSGDTLYYSLIELFNFIIENKNMRIFLNPRSDKSFLTKLISLGRKLMIDEYRNHFKNADDNKLNNFYTFSANGCIGVLLDWYQNGMKTSKEELASTLEKLVNYSIKYLL